MTPADLLRAHDRIRVLPGGSAVFLCQGRLGVFPLGSRRHLAMERDLPHCLVGVYRASVPANQFFDDVAACRA